MSEQKQQTLIEKLKYEHDDRELTCLDLFEDGHFDDKKTELLIQQTGVMAGLQIAIDIVKQHSEWIPVSEELPVLEYECGFRSFEPTNFYQIIDNEGCLHNAYFSTNHYANDDRALFTLCELSLYNGKWLVEDEYEVITVDMTKYWKPLSLPSESQEKIYHQEMGKIKFCGCGCILAEGSDQCSDCGALYDM